MKKMFFLLAALTLTAGAVCAEQNSNYLSDLAVNFGYSGKPYPLHLYDNETAVAIARHVGNRDWQLPIVGFEGFPDSDVMQYYDIPSRYVIPSTPQTVTSEKAGEVYYSKPNRLVLFYHDAQVRGEFTKVGHFDVTSDFIEAVEKNPVLEGWGVLIIKVQR